MAKYMGKAVKKPIAVVAKALDVETTVSTPWGAELTDLKVKLNQLIEKGNVETTVEKDDFELDY